MQTENSKILSLIRGCRENDRNCQKEMYYLLRGFAMKICFRYTDSQEESEELVNESFIKLFRNMAGFEEGRHADVLISLKGWFKRIVINTCIDQYRRKQSSVSGHVLTMETERLPDKTENGLDVLSYKEIISAIRQLSPAYRAVFNLFVIEGLSHEQISSKLGISVGASKSNLSKAREKLRNILINKSNFTIYVSPQ